MSRRTLALVVVVVALFAGACSSSLPGQPTGPMELTARFDDIGNMRPGHLVKVADVTVGSVTGIALTDDNRARVTMSIDDIDLPTSTKAYVRTTSVLGEKFIELQPPLDPPEGTAMLADGDEVAEVGTAPEFEEVIFELGGVLAAISGSDLATMINEANTALNGRAGTLSALLVDLRSVTSAFAEQSDAIVRTVVALDGMAQQLNESGGVRRFLDNLEEASGLLAENRDRLVEALEQLAAMAGSTQTAVFGPHRESITAQIGQLQRFVSEVQTQQADIAALLPNLGQFADNADKILQGDYINDYVVTNFDSPALDDDPENTSGGGG